MAKTLTVDNINVAIYPDATAMGQAAAAFVEEKLKSAIVQKGVAHMILATGASQFPFLDVLKQRPIDWQKIVVFHLDEYKALPATHPASFRKYLKDRILDEVKPQQVFFLEGDAEDIEAEMTRYATALERHPID
ncbi:MAG: 6-phosphogluconolactonase, partial [Bacteroidota bacterium]